MPNELLSRIELIPESMIGGNTDTSRGSMLGFVLMMVFDFALG